jgi:hypothetical protein
MEEMMNWTPVKAWMGRELQMAIKENRRRFL